MTTRLTIDDLDKSVVFIKDDASTPAYEFNLQTGVITVNGNEPSSVSFAGTQYCSAIKCYDCTTVNCTTVQCTTIQCTTVQCTTIQCTTVQCSGYCTANCNNCTNSNPSGYDFLYRQCSYSHCYNCTNVTG